MSTQKLNDLVMNAWAPLITCHKGNLFCFLNMLGPARNMFGCYELQTIRLEQADSYE